VPMIRVREISSPIALAACGAFLVPEPLHATVEKRLASLLLTVSVR
jgi:hypothetical protein